MFKEPSEGRSRQRKKPINPETYQHELDESKWAGVKEAFLYLMTRYDPDGPCCEECGRKGNARTLDLHHIRRRGQGGEYAARNAELLCRPCHQAADGNDLRWTPNE